MKRNELIELRELVIKEREKRKRINELLKDELIEEYLRIKGFENEPIDDKDTRDILKQILGDFKITKTNGIYVCTSAYYIDCHISYQDTEYYTVDVDIDSKYAEKKKYMDIESKEFVIGTTEDDGFNQLIKDFESNHIILNPYNTHKNNNGFEEVRMDFFERALEQGQAKSKRFILDKYPRL